MLSSGQNQLCSKQAASPSMSQSVEQCGDVHFPLAKVYILRGAKGRCLLTGSIPFSGLGSWGLFNPPPFCCNAFGQFGAKLIFLHRIILGSDQCCVLISPSGCFVPNVSHWDLLLEAGAVSGTAGFRGSCRITKPLMPFFLFFHFNKWRALNGY